MLSRSRTTIVFALGTAQALAWASSIYLPAVLAGPAAADLHLSRDWFFGAFSAALLLSALLSPYVGRLIDRSGGRGVLATSNLVFAAGLTGLAMAGGLIGLVAAWAILGAGMALGLYEAAFATLAGLYGRDAKGAITGITLIGGFASTIGWPTTSFLINTYGWREACLAWALLHVVLGLPLNLLLVPATAGRSPEPAAGASPAPILTRSMLLLMIAFGGVAFVTSAMAAHLPRLLIAAGVPQAGAIAAAALVGPAQVAARLAEYSLLRRMSAPSMARLAAALHPVGAACLAVFGAPAATGFAVLHGAGNGMLTIARGTLPLALFGPDRYGSRTGLLAVPARMMQAAAPFLFGLLLDRVGVAAALALSGGLSVLSLAMLACLRPASES